MPRMFGQEFPGVPETLDPVLELMNYPGRAVAGAIDYAADRGGRRSRRPLAQSQAFPAGGLLGAILDAMYERRSMSDALGEGLPQLAPEPAPGEENFNRDWLEGAGRAAGLAGEFAIPGPGEVGAIGAAAVPAWARKLKMAPRKATILPILDNPQAWRTAAEDLAMQMTGKRAVNKNVAARMMNSIAEKAGFPTLPPTAPYEERLKRIVQIHLPEIEALAAKHPSEGEFYHKAAAEQGQFLEDLAASDPRYARMREPGARALHASTSAALSSGNPPIDEGQLAVDALPELLQGRIPTTKPGSFNESLREGTQWSQRGKSVLSGWRRAQRMIKDAGGDLAAFERMLLEPQELSDIARWQGKRRLKGGGYPSLNPGADFPEMVAARGGGRIPGYYTLGPKIGPYTGQGLGDHRFSVLDTWGSRAQNRPLGTLFHSGNLPTGGTEFLPSNTLITAPRAHGTRERDLEQESKEVVAEMLGLPDVGVAQSLPWHGEKRAWGILGMRQPGMNIARENLENLVNEPMDVGGLTDAWNLVRQRIARTGRPDRTFKTFVPSGQTLSGRLEKARLGKKGGWDDEQIRYLQSIGLIP